MIKMTKTKIIMMNTIMTKVKITITFYKMIIIILINTS